MVTIGNIYDNIQCDENWAIVRSMRNRIDGRIQIPELSPSTDLFHQYLRWRDYGAWNQETFERLYVPKFISELKGPAAQAALRLLQEEYEHKHIALTCYCKDESLCHRSIIAGILQGYGIDVGGTSKDYSHYYDMYMNTIHELM